MTTIDRLRHLSISKAVTRAAGIDSEPTPRRCVRRCVRQFAPLHGWHSPGGSSQKSRAALAIRLPGP